MYMYVYVCIQTFAWLAVYICASIHIPSCVKFAVFFLLCSPSVHLWLSLLVTSDLYVCVCASDSVCNHSVQADSLKKLK